MEKMDQNLNENFTPLKSMNEFKKYVAAESEKMGKQCDKHNFEILKIDDELDNLNTRLKPKADKK